MNTTVRSLMRLQSIEAYGTSEGVKKEWDTRGRKFGEGGKSRPASGYGEDTTEPSESKELPKGKANTSAPSGPPWYGAPRTTGYDKWFSEQKKQMKGHEGETSNFGTKHVAPLKAYGTSEGVKKEWDSRPHAKPGYSQAAVRLTLKNFGFQRQNSHHFVGKHPNAPGQYHVEFSDTGAWRHYKGDRPKNTIGSGDSSRALADHLQERGFSRI